MLDEFGYPNEKAHSKIIEWPSNDFPGLIKFVKNLWWQAEWGWREEREDDSIFCFISTGGWSENEELIGSMKKNQIFWLFCWVASHRGGHYEFEVKKHV